MPGGGLVPAGDGGQPLCRASDSGGVRYWKEAADSESRCNAIERVTDIVRITDEYMSQMDAAPDLKAGSLSENDKLKLSFNVRSTRDRRRKNIRQDHHTEMD